MDLYLIRHSSVAVPPGTCYGWTDVPVSPTFREEAELCKTRLSPLHFDAVYTSPLSRARLLATYCGYPDALVDARLMEMNMGDWEMQRFDEIEDPMLQEYYDNYLDSPTRNGESFQDLYRRVATFLSELRSTTSPGASVALFCHGGPIICAMIYVGLSSPEEGYSHLPPYCSVTHLTL